MIFVIEFKKHVASNSIFGIIIGKLCHKKNLCSIILFKINKNLKVGFYYTILPFGLAIYCKIEGD